MEVDTCAEKNITMQITSMRPLPMETSTASPTEHVKSLRSICIWWRTQKDEDLPDICHWFTHPQDNVFRIRNMSSKSHFGAYGPLTYQDAPPSHNSPSASLVLMLGGVFLILLISMLITCIKRRKEGQVGTQAYHS